MLYHRLSNSFVNLYLIDESDGPNGLTLIDAGLAKSAVKLVMRKIAELGRQPSDLKRILITHADPDHYGGAAEIKAATGARLYASAGEAEAMHEGRASRKIGGGVLMTSAMRLLERTIMKMTPVQVDDILVPGQVLPILGGLRVIATPGHAPEHVSFYAPAKRWLFAGDSLNASTGKIRWMKGAIQWDSTIGLASARMQLTLGATDFCCGHGSVVKGPVSYEL